MLAAHLRQWAGNPGVVVLGVPRGGVPVAVRVARALRAPLDVLFVRKLLLPGHRDLSIGAIAGDIRVLNRELIAALSVPESIIERLTAEERHALARREGVYRSGRKPIADIVGGRPVILVDDGLATGSTMTAAVQATRTMKASTIVAVAPVGSREAYRTLEGLANQVICPLVSTSVHSIRDWYYDFSEVTDAQVRSLLTAQDEWFR
jgi:predicted phosphoribosyltransferase